MAQKNTINWHRKQNKGYRKVDPKDFELDVSWQGKEYPGAKKNYKKGGQSEAWEEGNFWRGYSDVNYNNSGKPHKFNRPVYKSQAHKEAVESYGTDEVGQGKTAEEKKAAQNADALSGFDEEFYLRQNPDVNRAAKNPNNNSVTSAEQHYETFGQGEMRPKNMEQMQDVEFQNTRAMLGKETLTDRETFNPVMETPAEGGFMDPSQFQLDPNKYAATAGQAQAPDAAQAEGYEASTIGDNAPQAEAAQGNLSKGAEGEAATREGAYEDFRQTIEQARAEAEQFEMDKRATVQFQYNQLMDFEPGDIPGWAKGAIREAESRMASRGLGASSMTGEAVASATLRAALPIAQQDARAFQTMSLEKFNKRQQATFMQASHLANLDTQSLNNRQQMAVNNARSFLQMDMQNLSNRQQTAIVNTQSRLQAMMSDQAAENAAKQFNAQSKNDMKMFYDNLQTQVDTFNAAQRSSISKFNTKVQNNREQFNVKNALLIERSNVEYMRGISKRNTAMQNEANYVNSQNILDISNTAMQNEIQLLRDETSYAFEMSENMKDRALTKWTTSVNNKFKQGLFDAQQDMAIGEAVGSVTANILTGQIENGNFGDAVDWVGDQFGGDDWEDLEFGDDTFGADLWD